MVGTFNLMTVISSLKSLFTKVVLSVALLPNALTEIKLMPTSITELENVYSTKSPSVAVML